MLLKVDRVEKKYLIDEVAASIMKTRLDTYMKQDPHNGPKGYMVRSVYFDSIRDRDYYEKEDGLDHRKKIRLRIYDPDSENVKLELKEKHNGQQRKQSMEITREEAKQMLKGDYQFLQKYKKQPATTIYAILVMDIYRPKCMVEYNRFAYILQENDIRITFDSELRASESDFDLFKKNPTYYPVAHPSQITLEVKYNRFLLSNIKKALSIKAKVETSNSKYVRARMISKQRGGF